LRFTRGGEALLCRKIQFCNFVGINRKNIEKTAKSPTPLFAPVEKTMRRFGKTSE
jgi:hypothetical protein